MPITDPEAAIGNRVGSGHNVIDHDNYVQEVIYSKNNDHRELFVITGRLRQPVNRQ